MGNYFGALAGAEALKKRTKSFAIRIIKLSQALPRTDVGKTLGRQVLRSGTSVAANYRTVCRARSRAEFVSRMAVVVEEPTKRFSGWSCWSTRKSFPSSDWMV
jgi:hypothetical protein